jgi:hypothetical protein
MSDKAASCAARSIVARIRTAATVDAWRDAMRVIWNPAVHQLNLTTANTPTISARAKLGMFKYGLFATAKPKNATLAAPGPGYFRLLEFC